MAWTPGRNNATIPQRRERVEVFDCSNPALREFSASIGVAHASMRIRRRWLARDPSQHPALMEEKVAAPAANPPPSDPTMVIELQAGR